MLVSCAMDQRWTDTGFRNCTCQMNLQPPFILGNGLQNPCLALRENVVKEVQSVNFPLHLLVTKARATAIQLTPTFFSLQYGAIYSRVFLKVCPGNSFSIAAHSKSNYVSRSWKHKRVTDLVCTRPLQQQRIEVT